MQAPPVLAISGKPTDVRVAAMPDDPFTSPEMQHQKDNFMPLRHKTTPSGGMQLSLNQLLSSAPRSNYPSDHVFKFEVSKPHTSPHEIALVTPPVVASKSHATAVLPHFGMATISTTKDQSVANTSPPRSSPSSKLTAARTPPTHLLMEYSCRGRFKTLDGQDISSMLRSPPPTVDTTHTKQHGENEWLSYASVDDSISSAYSLCSSRKEEDVDQYELLWNERGLSATTGDAEDAESEVSVDDTTDSHQHQLEEDLRLESIRSMGSYTLAYTTREEANRE